MQALPGRSGWMPTDGGETFRAARTMLARSPRILSRLGTHKRGACSMPDRQTLQAPGPTMKKFDRFDIVILFDLQQFSFYNYV